MGEPYPTLSLTEKSGAVLRGETRVMLTESVKTRKESKAEIPPHETMLFDRLKALRTTYAQKENVPPYIIFSDATLLELATFLPLDISELTRISGFGEVKTRRYGKAFLGVVSEYCREHALSSKMSEKLSARRYRRRE